MPKASLCDAGQMEAMTETAKSFGAKGLAYIKVESGECNVDRSFQ